jgi:hypothetical protein
MGKPDGTGEAAPFYCALLQTLQRHKLPFLIGGAFGFAQLTGIRRPTKDLDIFIRQRDWDRLAGLAADCGYRTELTFPHWLGKVHSDCGFVDVIFNSGNGLSPVDDSWFDHAPDAQVLGMQVKLMPVEEKIWTKGFIMERERFDGADVAHLIHACALSIDWQRLLQLFGPHWRVLLAHLVLFGFIYPGERNLVPDWLMDQLGERLREETHSPAPANAQCAGTLLSREQYLPDVAQRGYEDVRLGPQSTMTTRDVAEWTAAIDDPEQPTAAPVILTPAPTPRRRRRAA